MAQSLWETIFDISNFQRPRKRYDIYESTELQFYSLKVSDFIMIFSCWSPKAITNIEFHLLMIYSACIHSTFSKDFDTAMAPHRGTVTK